MNNIERYALRYQEACVDADKCDGDLPVKDCYNNLIVFAPQSGMTLLGLNGNETRVMEMRVVFILLEIVFERPMLFYMRFWIYDDG